MFNKNIDVRSVLMHVYLFTRWLKIWTFYGDWLKLTGWSWNAFWQKRGSNNVPKRILEPNETVFCIEKKILKHHVTNVHVRLIQYVIATHLTLLSRISCNFIVKVDIMCTCAYSAKFWFNFFLREHRSWAKQHYFVQLVSNRFSTCIWIKHVYMNLDDRESKYVLTMNFQMFHKRLARALASQAEDWVFESQRR